MTSSPGWRCHGATAPGAMSMRAWMVSRPAIDRSCRCRSVRVTPAGVLVAAAAAPAVNRMAANKFEIACFTLRLLADDPVDAGLQTRPDQKDRGNDDDIGDRPGTQPCLDKAGRKTEIEREEGEGNNPGCHDSHQEGESDFPFHLDVHDPGPYSSAVWRQKPSRHVMATGATVLGGSDDIDVDRDIFARRLRIRADLVGEG